MIKYLFLTFFLVSFLPINTFSQVISAEPRNKIDINITANVTLTDNLYAYTYAITSNHSSKQNVWMFEVRPFYKEGTDQKAPSGWTTGMQMGFSPITGWDADSGSEVRPGKTVEGFIFVTTGLPRITDYYAEGWAPIPEIEWEIGNIPGYDDLTPYGPGVVGKTIGPTAPPADFKPIEFLDYIISIKKEAYNLGWIIQGKNNDSDKKDKKDEKDNKHEDKEHGIMKSLDKKLDEAREKLVKGNTREAIEKLWSFIHEVEALYKECEKGKRDKDKKEKEGCYHPEHHHSHITSEAYGLLKYNVQYLVEKLK